MAEGIAVYINATADLFLIHPSNRSRLLLDWKKMNSNGYNIKVAGASRSKISECVAFGISSKQNVREQQIVANRKLVSSSEGFVAPVSGKEQ